jgi:hypothetical protein
MKNTLICFVFLILINTNAQAEAYVGLNVGAAIVNPRADLNANSIQRASGASTFYSYNSRVGLARGFVGLKVHKNLDLEVGYFSTSNINVSYVNSNGTINEASSVRGGDLSLIFRPLEKGVFFRAGAHRSQVKTAFSNGMVGVITTDGYQTGTGYLLGLGYAGEISKDADWIAEYTYLHNLGGVEGLNAGAVTVGVNTKFK